MLILSLLIALIFSLPAFAEGEVVDMGVADSITKEEIDESTQKAVDYLESGQALKDLDAYYAKHPDQQH